MDEKYNPFETDVNFNGNGFYLFRDREDNLNVVFLAEIPSIITMGSELYVTMYSRSSQRGANLDYDDIKNQIFDIKYNLIEKHKRTFIKDIKWLASINKLSHLVDFLIDDQKYYVLSFIKRVKQEMHL